MSATISPRLHPGFGGRRGRKVFPKSFRRVAGSLPLGSDSHPKDRGPRRRPPAAPTESGPATRASSSAQVRRPRPPSAPLTFFILVSRSMLGVGGAGETQSRVRPRSPLRELRRRCRSYSPCALELPQPGSTVAGTWNKEALTANGSGAAPGSGQSASAARTFAA